MTSAIRFYSAGEPYGWFSNCAESPCTMDGETWPTVEHYFQAQKFPGTEHADKIRRTPTPAKAKSLGRSRKVPIRPDWEEVKEEGMLTALRAKFDQNPQLREWLLATGDAELIEAAPRDAYWGEGQSGTGRIRLGRLLEQVRQELR